MSPLPPDISPKGDIYLDVDAAVELRCSYDADKLGARSAGFQVPSNGSWIDLPSEVKRGEGLGIVDSSVIVLKLIYVYR